MVNHSMERKCESSSGHAYVKIGYGANSNSGLWEYTERFDYPTIDAWLYI